MVANEICAVLQVLVEKIRTELYVLDYHNNSRYYTGGYCHTKENGSPHNNQSQYDDLTEEEIEYDYLERQKKNKMKRIITYNK